ncbi:MAG TPA: adenine phosphoribosyltransferase [Candidatus Nanopelagicales bacterium]
MTEQHASPSVLPEAGAGASATQADAVASPTQGDAAAGAFAVDPVIDHWLDTDVERLTRIRSLVRDVPDFPKPGILFRDITTVLRDPVAWRATVDELCDAVDAWDFDMVVGIESRGFILGSAIAYQLGVGFVPVRKRGKLPAPVHSVEYALEYGLDSLEIHRDALEADDRVLIVDDLLATGGTAAASVRLVAECRASVVGMAFLVELAELGGRAVVQDAAPQAHVAALLSY